MKSRIPAAANNRVTLVGSAIASLALVLILFFLVVGMVTHGANPYLGIITFAALPAVLNGGIVLAIFGYIRHRRRLRAGMETTPATFTFNTSDRTHWKRLFAGVAAVGAFLLLTAFGSYQAYQYTETEDFCGRVCHSVMKPEYVAYKSSPHARVGCVQCHIGDGAEWFVKSKISGSYQVYSVLFNKYHRPIETPISNLRPARETCEKCHWPKQFYSAKLQSHTYYATDEKNTPSNLDMLVKIGGGNASHGATEGIHFHMFLNAQISYVAADRQRNVIPYVECKYPDGRTEIYKSTENPMTDEAIAKAKKLTVDCIECHNRPTHIYHNPATSLNLAMSQNWIDPTLPEIKRLGVEVLEKEYKTEQEATAAIASGVTGFYREKYATVASAKSKDIQTAVTQLQGIYKRNYFPEMKVSWKGHPDHIGHMYSPGCFRCHDGKHVNSKGKVLSRDCNTCHTIVAQRGADGKLEQNMSGLPFKHPVDIGTTWQDTNCSDCHAPQ